MLVCESTGTFYNTDIEVDTHRSLIAHCVYMTLCYNLDLLVAEFVALLVDCWLKEGKKKTSV